RPGRGLTGNVGRDVLAHLLTPAGDTLATRRMVSAGLQVRNPLPSSGGSDAEPGYQGRARAPQDLNQQLRGVTPEAGVAWAEAQRQVPRASAEAGWQGIAPQDRVWVQRQQG